MKNGQRPNDILVVMSWSNIGSNIGNASQKRSKLH